jgi:outer membrane protein
MKLFAGLLAVLPCLAIPVASAYEKTDLVWRLSLSTYQPSSSSELLVMPPVGAEIDTNRDTRIGVAASYMINDHFAVGVHTAWPFGINFYADDGLSRSRAGRTRLLPVTTTVQYYLPRLGRAKPWLGVGWNYTRFSKEAVGSGLAASADGLRLQSARGLAGEAGVDWDLNGNYGLSLHVLRLDSETMMEYSENGASADRIRLTLDPWVWSVGLTRRF